MGQTLTHGIYLPDEGERNCYNGLAGNWQLLDGAVGTVAEHTSQIAGKAPLVHTHTKSQITDFPAYGTTAGTICEGNDSRLSDARTPVAHTHTKSDITNLFNSANTWTGNNTFTGITELSATAEGRELLHNTWHGYEQYYTRGTSNYPNYDTFLKWNSTRFDNTLGLFKSVGVLASTTEGATVDDIDETFAYYIYHINNKYVDFMNNVRIVNNGTSDILAPISNGTTDLGTSTNKWKSLNGINPGALSLPNLTMQTYDPNNGWYDLDTTGWDLTGSPIDISSNILKDGYLYVCLACDSTGYVVICEGVFGYPNSYYSASGLPVSGYARALLPVRKGTDVRLYLKGTSIYSARLFPALGNV